MMEDPTAVEAHGIRKPEGEDRWQQYRRVSVVEVRPYEAGEDMTGIHVPVGATPQEGDYIVRDPANRADQWLVSAQGLRREFRAI
jgi:hypothetical protein